MSKVIDITEKLDLSGNPSLIISGRKIEVKSDAGTGLKIIGLFSDESLSDVDRTMKLFKLIFSEKDCKVLLNDLGLSLKDLQVVLKEAQAVIMGTEDTDAGEDQTHITT